VGAGLTSLSPTGFKNFGEEMRYKAIVRGIRNINTFDAEIDLGFGVKVNATLRLRDISSLKNNSKLDEAVKYLKTELVGKQTEIDIKLAKNHSLAIIYLDSKNINQELISKDLAKQFIKRE